MKTILFTCMLGLYLAPVFAQAPDFSADCKAQMQKLAYFIGNWKGEATYSQRSGKSETLSQSERIEWRLNGIVLEMEGTGRRTETNEIIFNAFAVVNYDPSDKKFKFRSYVKEGFTTNRSVFNKSAYSNSSRRMYLKL